MDIFHAFRQINPEIVLGINTNGAIQSTEWWSSLGTLFNKLQDYVVFSIDGLEDTNQIYRKNVNWRKLMSNAKAYIDAGGSAHWDMLVYQHNQHQVDECQSLAQEMGFNWFRAKVSKRKFTNILQPPVNWLLPQTHSSDIKCIALADQSIYIDAQGNLSPCCWLGSRQKDFVTDFDSIQSSWNSPHPNAVCVTTCGSKNGGSSFSNQWQREIQLC
jgi:sulfatase maturation enzyme AslB (radical SAM superfamily)